MIETQVGSFQVGSNLKHPPFGDAVSARVLGLLDQLPGSLGLVLGDENAALVEVEPGKLVGSVQAGHGDACLIGGGLVLAPLPFGLALLLFGLLFRPAGLWPAAAVGLLAYPVAFVLLETDRWRLIGLGFAYLLLAIAWTASARRRARR